MDATGYILSGTKKSRKESVLDKLFIKECGNESSRGTGDGVEIMRKDKNEMRK
jgi:hypothetical protein